MMNNCAYHCLTSPEVCATGSFAAIMVGMDPMDAMDDESMQAPHHMMPVGPVRSTVPAPTDPFEPQRTYNETHSDVLKKTTHFFGEPLHLAERRSPKRSAPPMHSHDEAQYTRTRVLTPAEEDHVSKLWNHVATGLMQGILTEHAHMTLYEPGQGHLGGLRRIEMKCAFPAPGRPTYRLAVPSPSSYGLTVEQHDLLDRMIHVQVFINGIAVIDGLLGFRVRDPQTLDNFRSRFREIMDGLRHPTLLPSRPIPPPIQPLQPLQLPPSAHSSHPSEPAASRY